MKEVVKKITYMFITTLGERGGRNIGISYPYWSHNHVSYMLQPGEATEQQVNNQRIEASCNEPGVGQLEARGANMVAKNAEFHMIQRGQLGKKVDDFAWNIVFLSLMPT